MIIQFLLPAYNEAENIEKQTLKLVSLADYLKLDYMIHIVNDGSQDETPQIVKNLQDKNNKIKLYNHKKNQGPGKAFDTAFREIFQIANDSDAIISMDADNTHSEGTIKMMVARLKDGYEMVIASVFAPGGMMIGLPFIRYMLTLSCNFLYRFLFPITGIKEYTGFYRGYQVGALKRAFKLYEENKEGLITVNGFSSAAELLIKLRRIPLFMVEVPMLVRYDQKGGKSKMRIFATIFEHLRIIFHNLFRRKVF